MKDLLNYNSVFGLCPESEVETLKESKSDLEWRGAKDREQDDQLRDYG